MKIVTKFFSLMVCLALVFAVLPVGSAQADPPADLDGPLVSAVAAAPNPVALNGTVTLTAEVDDQATGGSDIKAAEYNLDGGAWVAMAAADGAYDSKREAVTASFIAGQLGDHQVCARGTDAVDNVGQPACVTLSVQDLQGPLTSQVAVTPVPLYLNSLATVTALVDDTAAGGSNILSAEYSLNGGAWAAMAASDGTFDSPSEAVMASFKAVQVGPNQVCVRGSDAAGNVGEASCASFTVQYVFKGFFAPIRMGVANNAKAGRTVPVKWQLKDGNGKPISDRTSFVALKSYPVDCVSLQGDPAGAVVERGPGKSGLKYNGKGKWHFNWKTPKDYGGTCRIMFVEFKGGQISPEVLFIFK